MYVSRKQEKRLMELAGGTFGVLIKHKAQDEFAKIDGVIDVNMVEDNLIVRIRDEEVKPRLPSRFRTLQVCVMLPGARVAQALSLSADEAPEEDKLHAAVNSDSVQDLIDGVISSGVLAIRALTVKAGEANDEQLSRFIVELAHLLVKEHADESAAELTFTTTIESFSDEAVVNTAKIIANEVNDYTNAGDNETRRIARVLKRLIRELPTNPRTTKVVSTRAIYPGDDNQDERHLTVTLYLNTRTGRAVAFYMVEGKF
jgi:hypothetical protein